MSQKSPLPNGKASLGDGAVTWKKPIARCGAGDRVISRGVEQNPRCRNECRALDILIKGNGPFCK